VATTYVHSAGPSVLERVSRRVDRLLFVLAEPAGRAAAALVAALPGLLGLVLLSVGAWMAYHPAGFIVPGALLLADKVATERRNGRPGGGG
jgi:hypothetical protein